MSPLATAAQAGWQRARGRAFYWTVGLAILATATVALVERSTQPGATAATSVLTGVGFGLVAPLAAYTLTDRVLGGQGLEVASAGLVRFGYDRRTVALGTWLLLAGLLATMMILLGTTAVLITRAGVSPTPVVFVDLFTTAWVALLGGITYASWLLLGSTVGARGWGRSLVLGVDLMAGGGTGLLAAFCPRAHLRSLLGGATVLDMPASLSLSVLVMIGLLGVMFSLRRTPA